MTLLGAVAKYRQLMWVALLLPILSFSQIKYADSAVMAADRYGSYLPLLYDKNVAVVANQTSVTKEGHLVDLLLDRYVGVVKVFGPEHGFRGTASAGEVIKDGKDVKTGLPIVSLYGSNKKPTAEQLADVDVVVFDIQDVGARFYTYISTLTYVMEACAENGKKVIVLDRPNPNGYYVDGPVLKDGYESFVGMHHIPVVHGMTIGEYAKMVNGEKWLKGGVQCQLDVVTCENWDHSMTYSLPVKPSPNLPNDDAIILYPSLCFFEGTTVSVGRGTDKPFQVIGAPYIKTGSFAFVPKANEGAKYPKYEGEQCYGFALNDFAQFYLNGLGELYMHWLVEAYNMAPDKDKFFNSFFEKLAGTDQLRKDIIAGKTAEQIRESWQEEVSEFKRLRSKYLLYKDFE